MKFRLFLLLTFFNVLYSANHFLYTNNNIELISLYECFDILHDSLKILDLKFNKNVQILHIRDPRDMVVIAAIQRANYTKDKVISYGEDIFEFIFKIPKIFRQMRPLLKKNLGYKIKFEDLYTGFEINTDVLKKLCKDFNLQIDDEKLEQVKKEIRLNNTISIEAEKGFWKKYFTPIHKIIFKKIAGKLLIELGYETDLNW